MAEQISTRVKFLRSSLRRKGIKFHHRHGEEMLEKLLSGEVTYDGLQKERQGREKETTEDGTYADEEWGNGDDEMEELEASSELQDDNDLPEFKVYTEREYAERLFAERKRQANRLVRVRISCMNPNKKNWTGEIFSVGSAKLGTFKKFIPYNGEEPYHIPHILVEELKARKCRISQIVKLSNGQEVNRYKLINEFAIEVLPQLTQEELTDLAYRQSLSGGVSA